MYLEDENHAYTKFITVLCGRPAKKRLILRKNFFNKTSSSFPTYVAFSFENGLTFSLWSLHAKNFVSGGTGHRCELSFLVENEDIVREMRKQWEKLGVMIEQDLHEAAFGLTFVALDPDGHRIRVCIPDK